MSKKPNQNTDILVIGSGVAGTGAGLAAARKGAKVTVVRRGFGSTAMASGAVRLDLPKSLPGGARPAQEIEKLLTDVLPLVSLGKRSSFLSSIARVVEADLVMPTMARGALENLRGKSLAVIGFKGLNEVRPEPIARMAKAQGIDAQAVKIPFPEAKHPRNLTTPELARLADDGGPVEKLAKEITKAAENFDFIALPPVVGLIYWEKVSKILDEALGDRWFELVSALPSVPGMRIQQALDQKLTEAGVEIIHGPILSWAGEGQQISGIRAGLAEGERVIAARQFILATGGVIGRGLRVKGDQIREALLGLPVDFEPFEEDRVEAPEMLRAGIKFDDQLRALDADQKPAFSNLRIAGELTGLTFASGKGGLGVALATGWASGELAAGAIADAQILEPATWQTIDTEDDPLGCLNCGLCLSRCPTIRALSREKQMYPGPRGMMAGLTRFESEIDEVADELSLCTLCGACSNVCLACVPVPENITQARKTMARIAPEAGPTAYQAMRNAFDKPKKLFDAEPIEGPIKDQAECVLFIGCSLPYYEREHAEATIKLLKALGVDFTMIDEVCCGGPLEVIGAEGAEAMAKHNIAEINRVGAKRIITICPRCAETMETTEAYKEFDVEHTTTLLARLLPGTEVASKLREKVGGSKVTFHDPCERARLAGEVEAARSVMNSVGLEVAEMPRSGAFTECCGAGGGVRAAQTRTSVRMARLRVLDALNTGAPTLLTECPSCLHNLYNGRKRKQKIEISNLSSYLGSQLDEV